MSRVLYAPARKARRISLSLAPVWSAHVHTEDRPTHSKSSSSRPAASSSTQWPPAVSSSTQWPHMHLALSCLSPFQLRFSCPVQNPH
eukprot:6200499-Pleurochrysis_carterae.AAC.1